MLAGFADSLLLFRFGFIPSLSIYIPFGGPLYPWPLTYKYNDLYAIEIICATTVSSTLLPK